MFFAGAVAMATAWAEAVRTAEVDIARSPPPFLSLATAVVVVLFFAYRAWIATFLPFPTASRVEARPSKADEDDLLSALPPPFNRAQHTSVPSLGTARVSRARLNGVLKMLNSVAADVDDDAYTTTFG